MVAAPQLSTMLFVGLTSGMHYSKDVYLSDVVNGLVNFSSGGAASATSETFWTPPEPVRLVDFSILTGMTDTTVIQMTRDSVPTGDLVRYANQLNTLNSRPILNIAFGAGQRVAAIQLA